MVTRFSFRPPHEHPSLLDVLDRIVDKGIVIESWERAGVVSIGPIAVEAWIAVAPMTVQFDVPSTSFASEAVSHAVESYLQSGHQGGQRAMRAA